MHVGVLGPLEVTSTDGSLLPVPGAKERLLLGILATEVNRAVSMHRLVDLLWNGAPPPTATRTLQSHVVRLRSALEPMRPRGSAGRYIVRRGPGYALALERSKIDAIRFADAVARGRAKLVTGEPAAARDEIAGGLALWRGDPYADWPDAEFAEADRRRLAEVKVAAQEGLLDADLALGRHAETLPDLERLTATDPLHEGWWSRLMVALYRTGRQGDALATARRARAVLADALGVDPGPEFSRLEAAILAHDPSVDAPVAAPPGRLRPDTAAMCPYKGLAAYQPEDASIFYGRGKLVRALVGGLVDSRLLVVSGPSGAGKSSAVLAGLLPALAAGSLPGSDTWEPIVIVPGATPVDALASLSDRDPAVPAVLVIDQFEELWTETADTAERAAFLDTLLGLLDDRVVVRLVVAVRGDHLGRLAEHSRFAERATRELFLVPPLTETGLREVIHGPVEVAGLRVEPELADAIVGDVIGQPGALPLLSTALVGTWERRRGNLLTLAGYLQAGGVDGALARSAEATYSSLDADAQQRVQPMLVRLAGPGEGGVPVRRRVSRDEIGLDGPDGPPRRRAVEAFVERRLLMADDGSVDVAHEALFSAWPRLAAWLADDAAGRAIRAHLVPAASEWAERGRPADELYRGSRLAAASEWRRTSDPDLTGIERDFLDASAAYAEAELVDANARAAREASGRRRTRRFAAGLAVALGVAIVAGGVAFQQRAEVIREARIVTARELAGAAIANLDVDPERSILLALEAVEVTRSVDGSVVREAEEALRRAVKTSRVVRTVPHGGRSIGITSDGERVITTGTDWIDDNAMVWDLQTGEKLRVLRGPGVGRAIAALSPDDRHVATAHDDGTVRLWDLEAGEVLHVLRGHEGYATYPTFSADGSWLATGGEDATVRVWNVSTGVEEHRLTGHDGITYGAAFNPEGTRLASTGEDVTVRIWDLATGATINTLTGHDWPAENVIFSPDGAHVLTAAGDGSARIWDAESGDPLVTLEGHTGGLTAAAYSPDGRLIATGGGDTTVRLWDSGTGRQLLTLAGHGDEVWAVAFTPDGDHVISSGFDDTTRLWDVSVGGARDWLTVPCAELIYTGVSFSPDGTRFAAPAEPSGITVWDTVTGSVVANLVGHDTKLTTVAFSPDGSKIASGSDLTDTPPVWDVDSGELLFTLAGHVGPARGVVFSPDGRDLVTGGHDGTVRIWDASTGSERSRLDTGDYVLPVVFSPDGRQLATGGAAVALWQAASLTQTTVLSGHTRGVMGVAYGPGDMFATAGLDGTARIRSLDSGGETLTVLAHDSPVNQVAISPDGSRIATTADDGTARLWDTTTGEELLTFYGHTKLVFGVAFSPDGRFLATASADGTVALHLLPIDEFVELARERVTRDLTDDECRQLLHRDDCHPAAS
jgi:WD40 repeat protein/DNA-binding SARP family transcriptional activator